MNAWRLAHTSTVDQATISIKTSVNVFATALNRSNVATIGIKIPIPVLVSAKRRNVSIDSSSTRNSATARALNLIVQLEKYLMPAPVNVFVRNTISSIANSTGLKILILAFVSVLFRPARQATSSIKPFVAVCALKSNV